MIFDGTNSILIYGIYSADGKTRYDSLTTKPVVGDEITVYGIIGYYNAPQMKNSWLTEQSKGHTHVGQYACSESCVYCDEAVTPTEAHVYEDGICKCGAALHTHVDADLDFNCDVEGCDEKVIPEENTTLTIPQVNALGKLYASNTYTTGKYYVEGIITEVYNTQYGNMYIKDLDGKTLTIYGTYNADGSARYDVMTTKPVAGDTVKIYGVVGQFNGTPQIKNGWIVAYTAHECNAVVLEAKAPTCTETGLTEGSKCAVCDKVIIAQEVVDALGHTTENGTCERCGEVIGGEEPAYETFTADFSSLTKNNQYATRTTTDKKWSATNAQVLQGGTADNTNNCTYKAIGDASTKAIVLNGKKTAKGVLTSATISGGISKLTFNYANFYSESNGVDFTITIKDASGATVATKKVDVNSITKNKAYELVWDLAGEGVAVTGDFTIQISNNSPSNNTGNKDRVAIWNIQWTNNPA